MAGAAINSVSGNFITAQPMGVLDGTDFQYTGSVREVDAQAISGCLDAGNIAIVSPVGYSPTGEVFNLAMEDVAVAAATALRADKLVFFSDAPVQNPKEELLPELTAQEAAELLARISGWYPSTAHAFRTQRFTRNTNRGMRNGSDIRPADIT